MKMTMHIDDKMLAEVMKAHGCATKTEAVNFALSELVRIRKLRDFAKNGLGLTPDELENAFYPDYDPLALRGPQPPSRRPNGKPRPRR